MQYPHTFFQQPKSNPEPMTKMNQSTEKEPQEIESSNPVNRDDHSASWIADRQNEIQEILHEKTAEISKRAQAGISERMSHYETALNAASESFETNEEDYPANLTKRVASKIHEASEYIQNSEPEQLVEDAADRVRAAPLIALGTAITCGFLAGRVLASAKDSQPAS